MKLEDVDLYFIFTISYLTRGVRRPLSICCGSFLAQLKNMGQKFIVNQKSNAFFVVNFLVLPSPREASE